MSGIPYNLFFPFANAPFTSGVSVALTDESTLIQEVLPSGSFIGNVWFQKGSFPSNGTLSIGWSGNTGAIVPASAGITTNMLNNSDVQYTSPNIISATTADHALVLTSDSDISSGTVNVIISYISYTGI